MWDRSIAIVYTCDYNGKYYAVADKVSQRYDLLSFVKSIPNCVHLNVCDSFKQAKEIAEHWNECYKKNNTYYFN